MLKVPYQILNIKHFNFLSFYMSNLNHGTDATKPSFNYSPYLEKSLCQGRKIAEFADSVDPDKPPHLDLHCLPSSL